MTDDIVIFFFGIFLFICLVLSTIGVVHISRDFRHFEQVKEQCSKQGYIQNYTTRITCKVEVQQ